MTDASSYLNKIHDYYDRHRDLVICSLITYIACYGEILFQKIGFHDDIGNFFDLGGTFTSGRWGLGLIEKFFPVVFGDKMWSLPVFNGMLVFVFLCFAVCILADFLGLKSMFARAVFCLLFMSSPALLCAMGYLFTAPSYAVGLLLAVICGITLTGALDLVNNTGKISKPGIAVGIICGAFSLGIYQCYISFALTLLLFGLIVFSSDHPLKGSLGKTIQVGICVIIIFIVYYIVMRLSLVIIGKELNTYKGMNEGIKISGIIRGTLGSYKQFLIPYQATKNDMFPFRSRILYQILLVLFGLSALATVAIKKIGNKIYICFLMALIPPAVYFPYLLTQSGVYDMMIYSNVLLFGGMLFWTQFLSGIAKSDTVNIRRSALRITGVIMALIMVYIGAIYWRYANQACLKAEFLQREYTSYLTTLVTRIQSTEGYTEDMPVLLYNTQNIKGCYMPKEFEKILVPPLQKVPPIKYSVKNKKRLYKYLQYWVGFDANYTDEDIFSDKEFLENMPHYPDAGSVQNVYGVLVVNF